MLTKDLRLTPLDLKISCFEVPLSLINQGYDPVIKVMECKDTKKGCLPKKKRDEMLKKSFLWAFTKVDESDFTRSTTDLRSTFTARPINFSSEFHKLYEISLRKVEIEMTHGFFYSVTTRQKTLTFRQISSDIEALNPQGVFLDLKISVDKHHGVYI